MKRCRECVNLTLTSSGPLSAVVDKKVRDHRKAVEVPWRIVAGLIIRTKRLLFRMPINQMTQFQINY
jgi:hypothetical protein